MTKPNKYFKLEVKDLEIIEKALEAKVARRSMSLLEKYDKQKDLELKQIRDLLGRIHHQKEWYKPKNNVFAGGG